MNAPLRSTVPAPAMPSVLPRLRFSGDWQAAAQSTAERCAELFPALSETLTLDLVEALRGMPGGRGQVETTIQRVIGACLGFEARGPLTQQQSNLIAGIRRSARYTLVQIGRAELADEVSRAQ